MKFVASQAIRQKQSLVITAQLQQAIKLLQMNNFELEQFIEEQSLENPFLEVANSETVDKPEPLDAQEPASTANGPDATDVHSGTEAADNPMTSEGMDNTFDSNLLDLGASSSSAAGAQDWDLIATTVQERGPSLYTHVCAEIDRMLTCPKERMVGYAFAEALEPSGWLGQPIDEMARVLNIPEDLAETVLAKLQTIEPAGLFARSLKECLQLQAVSHDNSSPQFTLLLDSLDVLAAGDMKALKKKCGVSGEQLRDMINLLRSFNPKPGTLFETGTDPIRAPDLIVTKNRDGWRIDLNRSTLPSVQIDRDYAQAALKSAASEEDTGFLKERVAGARWLKSAVEQRNATTMAVGAEIVKRQTAFLEKGIGALRPLVLRDVADAINVHESTVSRVTSGLLMTTPQGTFRLKDMFSVGVESDGEDGIEAASAIKFKIKKLIDAELPSAPYSDDAIVAIMAKEGITLARRTVAKYRTLQKIPSSFQRRREAIMAGHS
jgi:RNA polymerase sigma-54 factor